MTVTSIQSIRHTPAIVRPTTSAKPVIGGPGRQAAALSADQVATSGARQGKAAATLSFGERVAQRWQRLDHGEKFFTVLAASSVVAGAALMGTMGARGALVASGVRGAAVGVASGAVGGAVAALGTDLILGHGSFPITKSVAKFVGLRD